MKEKVEIGDATLFLGDCLEVLPTLGRFDAVITDPPFGVGNFVQISGNIRGEAVTWNESGPSAEFFQLLREKSTHRVIWGANYFNCFEGAGGLVWVKNQPMPNMSKAEMASTSWGNKVELINITWTNYVNTKESSHPCERPVELYKWCIGQVPKQPQTILDPFMGSGTTGVAAIQMGRKFTGIEREPKYFDIACKRIEQAYAQGQLFSPTQPKQIQESFL
jgi:site-specific DNA-methyltransferase (adenine-specific)/modification methylase